MTKPELFRRLSTHTVQDHISIQPATAAVERMLDPTWNAEMQRQLTIARAAPDMYAILRMALNDLEMSPDGRPGLHPATVMAMRLAVAQAEGTAK